MISRLMAMEPVAADVEPKIAVLDRTGQPSYRLPFLDDSHLAGAARQFQAGGQASNAAAQQENMLV